MKKYWEDPYVTSFEARIADMIESEGRLGLVFEETYFYPEGGGQPSDRGLIESRSVLDVQEVGERIIHYVESEGESDKAIQKGMVVSCTIDKEYRLHNMQIHSACHVLFGATRKLFPDVAYAGFNIGEYGSLYLRTERPIRGNDLREILTKANECVVEDRPITAFFVDSQEAVKINDLVYNMELPKGQVRIIETSGWDIAACSGTHLHRTGEMGLIKILAREPHKKNVTRIDYVTGKRAVAEMAKDEKALAETAELLGTSKDCLDDAVRKLSSDLQSSQKSARKLREMLVEYRVKELLQGAGPSEGARLIIETADYLDADSARAMVTKMVSQSQSIIAVVITANEEISVVAGSSPDIKVAIAQPIVAIAKKFGGGGGGKPGFVSAGGMKGSARAIHNEVETELRRILQAN